MRTYDINFAFKSNSSYIKRAIINAKDELTARTWLEHHYRSVGPSLINILEVTIHTSEGVIAIINPD